jgi:hypothetical protein
MVIYPSLQHVWFRGIPGGRPLIENEFHFHYTQGWSSCTSKITLKSSFSIECACFDRYVPLSMRHPEGRAAVPLQSSMKFPRGRGDRLRCASGIESAHATSLKSGWPLRAAEQALRLAL